jgi:hypothetical protein
MSPKTRRTTFPSTASQHQSSYALNLFSTNSGSIPKFPSPLKNFLKDLSMIVVRKAKSSRDTHEDADADDAETLQSSQTNPKRLSSLYLDTLPYYSNLLFSLQPLNFFFACRRIIFLPPYLLRLLREYPYLLSVPEATPEETQQKGGIRLLQTKPTYQMIFTPWDCVCADVILGLAVRTQPLLA